MSKNITCQWSEEHTALLESPAQEIKQYKDECVEQKYITE